MDRSDDTPPRDGATDRGDGSFLPPPTTPRPVTGGLRAAARSTSLGSTWWSRRWFAALSASGLDERLRRGRDYARGGQVVSLDITLGRIDAVVQGTRRSPYDTRIEVAQLDQLGWLDLARTIARRADHHALLLGGSMPDDVEAVFARSGLPLFPTLEDDLRVSCSCDDWATPCRHVAAVCYLVAEALDRDPFLVFRLRGIERDVLLAMLAGIAPAPQPGGTDEHPAPAPSATLAHDRFWSVTDAAPIAELPLDLQPPVLDAPVVQVLGALPMWRGVTDFDVAMRRLYARIGSAPLAFDLATGASSGVFGDAERG